MLGHEPAALGFEVLGTGCHKLERIIRLWQLIADIVEEVFGHRIGPGPPRGVMARPAPLKLFEAVVGSAWRAF